MKTVQCHESAVNSYGRAFPAVFSRSKGALLYAEDGTQYIDFFAGAGALNYGHNNDSIKEKLIDYLASDGIIHAMDMHTAAKGEFLTAFSETILKPRQLDFRVQFPGPTGTDAVEAALKLARKVTNRTNIFAFMGGYHGVSLGSLAVNSDKYLRAGAGLPLDCVTFLPYPSDSSPSIDTIAYLEMVLSDQYSGIDKPAAVIFETVQAEGGVIPAPTQWVRQVADLCRQHDILLICDDIQVGCGRTGPFFSFERHGIEPDIVTLSKSISGYGLPLSILLLKPELDIWKPGEHCGTFRANQLALVAATAALSYWQTTEFERAIAEKELLLRDFLADELPALDRRIAIRGVGMIWGIDLSRLPQTDLAKQIAAECFRRGLLVETVGRGASVLKLIPPLVIDAETLERGCRIICDTVGDLIGTGG